MRKAALLLLFLTIPSFAQDTSRSVYEIEPVRDIAITTAGFAAAGAAYVFGKNWIKPSCPCDPALINGFDRGAVGNNSQAARIVSDLGLALSLGVFPLYDLFDLGFSDELFEDAVVYLQALATSGALVSITKHVVQRPIPRVVAGQEAANDPDGYRAFYSGHTTLTFTALTAAAMTANLRYRWGIWPWLVTGAVGTTVGVTRILGGAHYPSDVIVGALIGISAGAAIPWWHAREEKKSSQIFLLPTPGGGAQLVAMSVW